MKKLYGILLILLLAGMLTVGGISLFDTDAAFSETENRELAQKPEFSVAALLNGSYLPALESYYSDTFPARETLLQWNRGLNRFYYFSGTKEENNMLIIGGNTGAEQGGESLESAEKKQAEKAEEKLPVKPEEDPVPEQKPEQESEQKPEQKPEKKEENNQPEEEQHFTSPEESEAVQVGNVVVVGTRAMEIPNRLDEQIEDYAAAVNALAGAMGEKVRTISLVTPNGGEFYSPESMHTGSHSQKDMIDFCYSCMDESIVTVDAYSNLSKHREEYVYFRTDHHWTQLGAYYAYQKFCEAAGFESRDISEFESGTYETFLGSMYTFTSGYPQSETLKNNPDSLTYYLPLVETHAKYYSDATLSDGIPISVVYTKMADSIDNKYLCYIGGDNPVCVIESAAEGGTCIVLKESYGNAFVPFLTSHYSKIIVIDPREFNREGMPSLNLTEFAAEQGIDDLIVINYPYMINSSAYADWLQRLVR